MITFNQEQRFIVTGASSGIGETVALLLNELGATVIGIGRNQERLDGMKAKSKNPTVLFLEKKDLAEDIPGLPAYVKSLKNKYGKFHGMAYCAGVGVLSPAQLLEFEIGRTIFATNYFAPLFFTKGLIDRRNNVGQGCSIVHVSSIDAILSTKGQCLYAGSKAALSASMKTLSREVSSAGVRINCVLPSMVDTPMAHSQAAEALEISEEVQASMYPFGWAKPIDIANFIVYLLSDKSRFVSGQNYIIDSGGML